MNSGNISSTGNQSTPIEPNPLPIGPTPAENAMNTPVRTLDEMKHVLIANLGEGKGMALYNFFISSFLTSGFIAMQSSSQQAAQAAKKMSQADPSQ